MCGAREEGVDRPLLYLIDALPYVFRAFFAIRKMRDPQGQPVNAVYGFTAFNVGYPGYGIFTAHF